MFSKTFLLEEELKRIGFIINYDSSKMVYENEEKKENLLIENKIDNLIHSSTVNEVVFEKTLKSILKEQWERTPPGKPKDALGYWKALFQVLTTGGIGVKWQVPNDPIKSTFMYWGSWVIWKDVNKNNGYPISFTTPEKNTFLFKFKDGVYKGTSDLSKLMLSSECINYIYPMNNSVFKNDQKTTFKILAGNMSKNGKLIPFSCVGLRTAISIESAKLTGKENTKSTLDAWNTSLGPFLEKNKPPTTTYFKGRTQQSLTYKTGQGLQFRSDGTIYFPKSGVKDGVPTNYGTWTWDSKTGIPIVKNLKGNVLDIGQILYNPYAQLVSVDIESEKLADQIFTELIKAFDYDNDGVWNDNDRTNETLAMTAINKIKSKEVLEKLNAKIAAGGYKEIQNVEQWFKLEMSDWDPSEWDSIATKLNSLGYSVPKASAVGKIYGYTVGGSINMADKTLTGVEDKLNYANKQTAGAVAKYSEIQVKDMLKNQVSPGVDFIGQLLLNAPGWFDDDEEIIEMAFSRIHSRERYNQLKTLIGQDPYKYVKSLITNTGIVHGKSEGGKTKTPLSQTIDASYAVIMGTAKITNIQPKQAYEKYKAKDLPFTLENPTGTKQKFVGEPLFWKVFEGKVKDPYLKDGKGVVPDGYLWGQNPSVYPIPQPYPTEDIQALRVYANQGSSRPLNERNKNLTEQVSPTSIDTAKIDFIGNAAIKKLRKMEEWNSELANQEKYIPKYCTAPNKIKERRDYKVGPTETENAGPVSESIYKNSKIKFSEFILEDPNIIEDHSKKQMLEVSGDDDGIQFKKTEGSTDTELTGKETVISMASQCRDFGGLWVYGTQTGKPECFCRDKSNPLLSGKVGTKQNNRDVYINVALDNSKTQSYTDWTHPDVLKDTAKTIISTIGVIAALFIPVAGPYIALVGGLANFGILASQGYTQEAALYLLFDLIPAGAAVTGIGKTLWKQCVKNILAKKILTVTELRAVLTVMNSSEMVSNKISQQLTIAAGKGAINKTVATTAKILTKQVEGELTKAVGADGITMKNLSYKVAQQATSGGTLAKV